MEDLKNTVKHITLTIYKANSLLRQLNDQTKVIKNIGS